MNPVAGLKMERASIRSMSFLRRRLVRIDCMSHRGQNRTRLCYSSARSTWRVKRNRLFDITIVLAFAALFVAWTVLLLRPIPPAAVRAVGGHHVSFWIGKTLHVGVYCC